MKIDRPTFLEDIQFKIHQKKDAKFYIHLTSKKIMREPLISLIINLRTVESNISHEFHLLLTPYERLEIKAVEIKAVEIKAVEIKAVEIPDSTPILKKILKKNTTSRTINKVSTNAEYRPDLDFSQKKYAIISQYRAIKSGDLITKIAQNLRADKTYSIQKISKLLFQLNSHAFVNGNINQLRVGTKLAIPSLQLPDFRKDSYSYLDKDKDKDKQQGKLLKLTKVTQEIEDFNAVEKTENNQDINTLEGGFVVDSDFNILENNKQKTLNLGLIKILEASKIEYKKLLGENKELRKKADLVIDKVEELLKQNTDLDFKINLLKSAKNNTLKDKNLQPSLASSLPITAKTENTKKSVEEIVRNKEVNKTKITHSYKAESVQATDIASKPTIPLVTTDMVKRKDSGSSLASIFKNNNLIWLVVISVSIFFILGLVFLFFKKSPRVKNFVKDDLRFINAMENATEKAVDVTIDKGTTRDTNTSTILKKIATKIEKNPKESKVKKSKVKESKIKESDSINLFGRHSDTEMDFELGEELEISELGVKDSIKRGNLFKNIQQMEPDRSFSTFGTKFSGSWHRNAGRSCCFW